MVMAQEMAICTVKYCRPVLYCTVQKNSTETAVCTQSTVMECYCTVSWLILRNQDPVIERWDIDVLHFSTVPQ